MNLPFTNILERHFLPRVHDLTEELLCKTHMRHSHDISYTHPFSCTLALHRVVFSVFFKLSLSCRSSSTLNILDSGLARGSFYGSCCCIRNRQKWRNRIEYVTSDLVVRAFVLSSTPFLHVKCTCYRPFLNLNEGR